MNTYDINKIKLPNGDICNLRDSNFDNFIQISDLQPTDDGTKIWISTNEAEEYEVPTYDEFLELKDQAMVTRAIDETNIIHIEDAAEKPLKECKIDIQPVQDLHGYDKPWVGGAGKNKWKPLTTRTVSGVTFTVSDNGKVTVNGTASALILETVTLPSQLAAGTYTVSAGNTTQNSGVSLRVVTTTSTTAADLQLTAVNASQTYTFADPIISVTIRIGNGIEVSNLEIFPQLEEGSTATTFASYSNICPITGFDSVKITRTGKNLFDKNDLDPASGYLIQPDAVISTSANYRVSNWIRVIPGEKYTVSNGTTRGQLPSVAWYDEYRNVLDVRNHKSYGFPETYTAPAGAYWMRESVHVNDLNTFMLEQGETPSAYESFGTAYSITFPSEVGTVYGGSLDVTNGVLTVDRASVDLGTLTWIDENDTVSGQFRCNFTAYNPNFGGNLICSILKGYPLREWNGAQNGEITLTNSVELPLLRVRDSLFINMSATEITEYLNGQTLVYELATPITYQLTPQEITTLLGINNIWADTGNISCTYYVNSQLNTELNNYVSKLSGTAKGDMIYYSNNATPSRLEIGNQGQVLKVTSDGVPHWNNENIAEYKTLTDQEIATFDDGIQNSTLKSYSVKIEPKQDLHGYNKPWIGGTGKNLLPFFLVNGIKNNVNYSVMDNGTVVFNGTANSTTTGDVYFHTKTGVAAATELTVLPAGNYKFSGISGGSTSSYRLYAAIYEDPIRYVGINDGIGEFTLSSATKVSLFLRLFAGTVFNNILVSPMIYAATDSDIFEPYENICPIEGFDSIEVVGTDVNIYDKSQVIYGKNWLNGIAVNRAVFVAKTEKGKTLHLRATQHGNTHRVVIVGTNKFGSNAVQSFNKNFQPGLSTISYEVTADEYVICQFERYPDAANVDVTQEDINVWNIAISYSEINSVSLSLVSSAGSTVYGGTVTINEDGNGILAIDKATITLSGITAQMGAYSTNTKTHYITKIVAPGMANVEYTSAFTGICDRFESYPGNPAWANVTTRYIGFGPNQSFRFSIPGITDFSEALQYINGSQVTYPLATPLLYTLTASQLKILLGTNHIWSDAGNITLTYPVNLKGYIDSINNLTDNYVKYTDYANNDTCGVVKTNGAFGILTDNTGLLKLVQPTDTEIQTATGMYKVITPYSQHKAAFYGLAKAAGDTTQASSTNTIGNYTQEAKTSIQDMLGISDMIAPVQETTIASKTYLTNEKFYYKGKIYKVTAVIFADDLITPGVNCEQITLAEAMPVSIIEGQGTNSLVLNDLIKTNATGVKSVAEGTSKAKAGYSHAEGQESEASGGASHAEGWYSKAKGAHSHAEGGLDNTRGKIKITGAANATTYTYTVVDNDFVENFGNHALYYNNLIYDISAIDIAGKTITVTKTLSASTALSNVQVSWGTYSYAQGINAHAENSAYAYSQGSHAEGVSVAADLYSHAEGKSYTIGEYSHAENNSIAAGNYSHAQGYGSTLGAYAHAQGYNTSAEGANSHVEGQHTTASRKNQHVFGKYNIKDEPANTTGDDLGTYVEIVGNGTSTSATSNARTLDWNGNEVLAGSLTIGGNEVLNKTTLQQLKKMPVNIVDGNGTNSIVLGNTSKAKATGTRAIAEATGTATGNNSHAEGWSTEAKATAAHSEGYFSKAVGSYSHAEGGYYATFGTIHVTGAANATTYTYAETFAYIEDDPNYLIIYNNTIYTVSSVDVTNQTITLTTTLNKSAAVSNLAVDLATTPYAYGNRSHAEGSAYAQGQLSHAQGNGTRATAFGSHAEGKLTTASGQYSHAEGVYTLTSGQNAHAEGMYTSATSDYAHVEGMRSQATNTGAHAEGYLTKASGYYSHAQGYNTSAKGTNSHAEGYSVSASGQYSHAEGFSTQASGDSSHAEGYSTQASGTYSHVEGLKARASGVAAHAEGNAYSDSIITLKLTQTATSTIYQYSQPTNPYCLTLLDNNNIHNCMLWVHLSNGIKIPHKITNINTANNTITLPYTISGASTTTDSIVADIGYYPNAEGNQSHAEGSSSAQGGNSHAEGYGTLAAQFASHAEGYIAQATGVNSHAEGEIAEASGKNAHAQGQYTIANHKDQHVFGRYNIADPNVASATEFGTYVEIVGNGNDVTRSNARTLDWNGNEVLAGSITLQNGTSNTITLNKAYFNQFPTNIINGTGTGAVIQGKIVPDEYIDDVGIANIASGLYSHAEGEDTTASAWNAHAQGYMSKATQQHTHAEGISTKATGSAAHTEGNRTQASGAFAHAQGQGTIANHRDQHASGRYNIADSNAAANTTFGTYVEIVGNGTDANTRSNARTLDWNGNETLAGNLTLGDHTLMPQAVPSVIFGTQTGTTAAWTGVAPFSTLIDGTVILYWLPQTSASNATLNLTLANGLTTGAKNIYIDGTTRCGTQIASGNLILMMYRYKPTIGSATDLQGWWIVKS